MEGKGWEKYKPVESDIGREMLVRGCDYAIRRDLMPEYFTGENFAKINFYWQYKTLGWPYLGGWAEQPGDLVDVVLLLENENGKRLKASTNG